MTGRVPRASADAVEIACDESGSEGENLVNGNTDVFAHASVNLDKVTAARCIEQTRERIRSPAREYKANHLLRPKNRAVLEWLLDPSGPIRGSARVYLVDKELFLIERVVDAFVEPSSVACTVARTLRREGRSVYGSERWQSFLRSANDLLRTRITTPTTAAPAADEFFDRLEVLRSTGADGSGVGAALGMLRTARSVKPLDPTGQRPRDPAATPDLDPLFPALVQAVRHWGGNGRPISIVHDEHVALTAARVAQIEELAGRLAGFRLVDSRADPRVQVADFLAGVARKLASDALNGRGDPRLTGLLQPFVDPCSIWPHDHRGSDRLLPA